MSTVPNGKSAQRRTAPAPARICERCDTITREPVTVAEIHGNSGPGWNVYACPPCAPLFPRQIGPFALLDAIDQLRRGGEGADR